MNKTLPLAPRSFATYAGWKSACKADPRFTGFCGNKEIADCANVGEWDGEKGIVYPLAFS